MPSTSSKQHRAMEAAAHGKSTLGIPKKVGRDFAKADGDNSFEHGGSVEHKQLAKQAEYRMTHSSREYPK